jgi:hypothetical protein
MPPINQAERRKAFLNFLIFFSVTITIIIVVIFFSIEVPFIDNRRLRNQVAEFQDQKELTRSLHAEIKEVAGLIKTLDSRDVNQAAVNAQIDGRVGTITNLVRNVSDSESVRYYSMLTASLQTWKNLKKDLSNAKTSEEDAARLNQEIIILKTQLAQKDQTIASLLQQRQQ